MQKIQFIILMLLVILTFTSLANSQTYIAQRVYATFTNPDNPQISELPRALNNSGRMVGSYIDQEPHQLSFTYPNSQILSNPFKNYSFSIIRDVNDEGLKIGNCRYSSFDFAPCIWNASGSPTSLGFIENYTNAQVTSVNNQGIVIGSMLRSEDPNQPAHPRKPFIWDSVNGMRFLGTSSENFAASGINNNGVVVGGEVDPLFGEFITALIWDSQDGWRTLLSEIGSNNGWSYIAGSKINNNGQIIGVGTFQGGKLRNFFWDGNVIYDLGLANDGQGGSYYEINNLNDLGEIAGAFWDGQLGNRRAFIWSVKDGLRYVDELVTEPGWLWRAAVDINNQGQILVRGQNGPTGIERSWILTKFVEKDPLIFIPGIAGSTLYEADSEGNPIEQLWLPLGLNVFERLHKLSLNPDNPPYPNNDNPYINSPFANVVPVDVVRSVPYKGSVYEDFLATIESEGYYRQGIGCSQSYTGTVPNMFIFPYDWRLSNKQNAEKLRTLINCIGLHYQDKKVDILTHSMGGLLARRYILTYPNNNNIDKLITTVAPWLGAPKAIDGIFTGKFIPITPFGLFPQKFRDVSRYGKGPHELLPSSWYFANGGRPLAYKGVNLLYTDAYDFVNREFSSRPYENSASFHQDPIYPGQDNWANDSTGIKYYHFYGIQNCNNTPGKLDIIPYPAFPLPSVDTRYRHYFKKRGYEVEGDETVPRLSAARTPQMQAPSMITNMMLKPPPEALCNEDAKYSHNGILGNEQLITEILSILNNGQLNSSEDSKYQSSKKPETTNIAQDGSMYYLDILGVDSLDITSGTIPTFSDNLGQEPPPGINYEEGSDSDEIIEYPHTVEFLFGRVINVEFQTTQQPISIEHIRGYGPNNAIETIKYLDLQLPVNIKAQLKFTAKGVENLRYDADGDGTFETEVQPTFVLSGSAANDKTPPSIDVSYTINKNIATVTINAADNETGLRQIRYIAYNEQSDHVYSSPFTMDLNNSQLIYIAAEDNAGNRSFLAKWIDIVVPVTEVNSLSPNSSGWYTADVSLELWSLDNFRGSGVKTLTYSASGSQPIPEKIITRYISPFSFPQPSSFEDYLIEALVFNTEGITNLNFFAEDFVGNVESTKSHIIKIDKSSPISQHISSNNGQQTTFTLSATDSISGVDKILYSIDGGTVQTYIAPFNVSNMGGHFVSYYAKDIAGNIEPPHTIYVKPAAPFDFDGDGRTDISIFRPVSGEWWYHRSSDGGYGVFQFGSSSDKIVPNDFTGDGITDIAVWRPSTGEWFVLRSEDSGFYSFPFGTNGDIPVPADYDGDGISDAAIFRPSNQTWYIQNSNGGYTINQLGNIGDLPITADFDGDGKSDQAVFNPTNGNWQINRSLLGLTTIQFGSNGDKPIPSDFTGDGRADLAVFRPSTNEWVVLRSEDSSNYSQQFGTTGDLLTPGDYDGDGKTDLAVFRPSSNVWYLQQSTNGFQAVGFGSSGDVPIPSAFVP